MNVVNKVLRCNIDSSYLLPGDFLFWGSIRCYHDAKPLALPVGEDGITGKDFGAVSERTRSLLVLAISHLMPQLHVEQFAKYEYNT